MSEPSAVEAKIQEIIEKQIRPAIQSHGGEIVYKGFENGVVKVSLQGACGGCPGATMTLKMGVEARLKEQVPEVTGVEAV